jgi:hypothetical protein
VVAEHDLTEHDGEKYYEVCDHVIHPKEVSNKEMADYDYAILYLCKDLIWAIGIAPVCLPATSGLGRKYEKKQAIMSGWGSTNPDPYDPIAPEKLQKAKLYTLSNELCCGASNTPFNCSILSEQMICAAGKNKGACIGDSGGPLVVQDDQFMVIIIDITRNKGSCVGDTGGPLVVQDDQFMVIMIDITRNKGSCVGDTGGPLVVQDDHFMVIMIDITRNKGSCVGNSVWRSSCCTR